MVTTFEKVVIISKKRFIMVMEESCVFDLKIPRQK